MRKIAFLLAASFFVSAPLLATVPTDAFAAKAKARAKVTAEDSPNTAFLRALADLSAQLSQPHPGLVSEGPRHKGKTRTAKR